MKFAWVFGVVLAIVLHAGFLLFGGWFFGTHKEKKSAPHEVELVNEEEAAAEKKKEKAAEEDPKKDQQVDPEAEEASEVAEIVKNLELSAAAAAPALEAASLSEIEQALSGQTGSGDFADSLSFASGGRIGGTAKAGSLDEKLENAFNLAEIDQKPRAVFQAAPSYPAEMRGKKLEGLVSVIFVVDPSGKVSNPRVEKSTHPAFERPALEAVRQWRFEAGLKGGQRVGCKMRVPIRFQKS